jgi:hypothetical protein
MSLRNGSHLPTTQCACVDFVDFATQRNAAAAAVKYVKFHTFAQSCRFIFVMPCLYDLKVWLHVDSTGKQQLFRNKS